MYWYFMGIKQQTMGFGEDLIFFFSGAFYKKSWLIFTSAVDIHMNTSCPLAWL